MSAVKEQSVIYTPNDETKFKLIGNIFEDGIEKLCVWESTDGIHFDKRNVVFANIPHDTQNVLIQRGDGYDLYTRLWLPDWDHRTNRKIAKCHLNSNFKPQADLQMLPSDYMYTNAASKLDSKSDMLFPTWFNDLEGKRTQEYHINTYICTNNLVRKVSNNLEEWLSPNLDLWMMVSPGIVSIGQYNYIAFQTRQNYHSAGFSDSDVTKYMLIRIQVN